MENNNCDLVNDINGLDAVLSNNGEAIDIDWSGDKRVNLSSVVIQNNCL